MRLEEFDLDLPLAPRPKRISFRRRTRCVSALFERAFPAASVDAPGWKVLVECVPTVRRAGYRNLEGALTLEVVANSTAFESESDLNQKKLALDWLVSGALELARQLGWSPEPFLEAAREVKRLEYKNERWLERAKWSPSRKLRADVWCVHEPSQFRAWLVVMDADGGEVVRELVVDDIPDEFIFAPVLGSVRWDSNTRVSLLNKKREVVGYMDVP